MAAMSTTTIIASSTNLSNVSRIRRKRCSLMESSSNDSTTTMMMAICFLSLILVLMVQPAHAWAPAAQFVGRRPGLRMIAPRNNYYSKQQQQQSALSQMLRSSKDDADPAVDQEASNSSSSTSAKSSSSLSSKSSRGIAKAILVVPLFCKFAIVLAIKLVTDLVVFPLLWSYRLARLAKRKLLGFLAGSALKGSENTVNGSGKKNSVNGSAKDDDSGNEGGSIPQ